MGVTLSETERVCLRLVIRAHSRSFQGHTHISVTPDPTRTKPVPRVALDLTMILGGRAGVIQGQKSFWGKT